jgi:hypothetical protein
MHHRRRWIPITLGVLLLVPCASLLPVAAAEAQRDGGLIADRKHGHRDDRHGHRRDYPHYDHRARKLPRRHIDVHAGGHRYYYGAGVWYTHRDGHYVVRPAPIGAVVGWLPPFHTTIWVHDVPYYYANRTYYLWEPMRLGYVVVEAPADSETVESDGIDLYIYPKEGQSQEQQADDRYACHAWGVEETGFDPSLPVDPAQERRLGELRSSYQRAMRACLEARGYTVR